MPGTTGMVPKVKPLIGALIVAAWHAGPPQAPRFYPPETFDPGIEVTSLRALHQVFDAHPDTYVVVTTPTGEGIIFVTPGVECSDAPRTVRIDFAGQRTVSEYRAMEDVVSRHNRSLLSRHVPCPPYSDERSLSPAPMSTSGSGAS